MTRNWIRNFQAGPTLFHSIMYDRDAPVGSYWEASAGAAVGGCDPLDADETADVAIIGAGFTGLSAAYHLLREGAMSVRVLEAGQPGWGASGRNGGHCCFGGAGLGADEIAERFGADVARRNIETQRASIELVRDLADSEDLEIDRQGDGELCIAHTPRAFQELGDEARMWQRLGGFDCELMPAEAFYERAYRGPHVHGAMLFPFGFGLHPMKYARELARLAQRHGAVIHGASPVTGWERSGGRHRLITPGGSVTAERVLIATNGYTRDDLHPAVDGCLLPVISQIVATRPLADEELAAHEWSTEIPLYDTRPMFSYLRMLPDRRLSIGSGGGLTGTPRSAERWTGFLKRRIDTMFPAWKDVEIDYTWRGFVCLTADRMTHLGKIEDDPGVFYSLAYHGNGVAMATWSGRAVAGLISGRGNETIPETMRQPLPRFPIPALRKWGMIRRYGTRMLTSMFR
jgi:glycine/D-amino acid oxidase-like deaminating enzyme